jgi:hypothetical protein
MRRGPVRGEEEEWNYPSSLIGRGNCGVRKTRLQSGAERERGLTAERPSLETEEPDMRVKSFQRGRKDPLIRRRESHIFFSHRPFSGSQNDSFGRLDVGRFGITKLIRSFSKFSIKEPVSPS